MRVKVGETVTTSLKVDLVYKCSTCGRTNLSTQQVSGQGYTSTFFGKPLSNHYKLAQEDLSSNLKYILESKDPMRFHRANFSCVCSHCKQMEPWTNLKDDKRHILLEICAGVFTFFFLFMIGNFQIFFHELFPASIFFLVIMALTGGYCLYKLIAKYTAKKRTIERLSKLPPESFPKIYPYNTELHSQLLHEIGLRAHPQEEKPKPVAASKNWTCPRCKRGNAEKNTVCWSCGYEQQ